MVSAALPLELELPLGFDFLGSRVARRFPASGASTRAARASPLCARVSMLMGAATGAGAARLSGWAAGAGLARAVAAKRSVIVVNLMVEVELLTATQDSKLKESTLVFAFVTRLNLVGEGGGLEFEEMRLSQGSKSFSSVKE
jgi:hypothetical protein